MFRNIKLRSILMPLLRTVRSWFVGETIFVLGDSHAATFYHWLFDIRFPHLVFWVVSVNGATASGLENPNSQTQAYKIFDEALTKHAAKRYILLLGEVDTGFVIWHRAQKYGVSIDQMLTQTVERYNRFIAKVRALGEVIVISAPLPTISDKNPCGEIANLRREVKASQYERTQLTLTFNQRICDFCSVNDVDFISLDADSLGKDGLVKHELLHSNPCNHHYHSMRYARLLTEKLWALFSSKDS